jgi:hypothetical protein
MRECHHCTAIATNCYWMNRRLAMENTQLLQLEQTFTRCALIPALTYLLRFNNIACVRKAIIG